MKTRAAVALEAGKPLEVMEVNLEGPKEGEVLIEIKATVFVILMNLHFQAPIRKACFQPYSVMKERELW